MQPATRLPHLVRGSSAAAIATFAALFSHVLAGGAVPEPLGICVPFVLSVLVSVLLAGRKLSLLRLSVSVIASQMLFHTLFVLGAPVAGSEAAAMAGAHQHHSQAALPVPVMTDHTTMLIQGDVMMWLSHFVGAAVTIVFLYRGEQTIHELRALAERLIEWAQHRLTAPLRVPAIFTVARVQPVQSVSWTALTQLVSSTRTLRGPPEACGIASVL